MLRQHQIRATEQFVKHCTGTGMLLWHRTGTGKTSTTLATLMNYSHARVLLLLPNGLRHVWVQEIQQNFGNTLPFQLQFMDYNTFFNKQQQQQVHATLADATLIVADEAHHLAEHKNKSLKLLQGKRCLLVTGTPVYNALTDLALLVNLAAGTHVLPYSNKKLTKLVDSNDMYSNIKNYVQYYDYAADDNAQVTYPIVRVINVTVKAHQLPLPRPGAVVYSQDKHKLQQMAKALQRLRRPVLLLTPQNQQILDKFATGSYVLLLDPTLAEGVNLPNATILHVLEPIHTFGLQEQLYARVKRPVAPVHTQPVHTIYQYIQPHQHVNHTLTDVVRKLRQQMATRQTSKPTCGLHVRACDVWKSTASPGTCAAMHKKN